MRRPISEDDAGLFEPSNHGLSVSSVVEKPGKGTRHSIFKTPRRLSTYENTSSMIINPLWNNPKKLSKDMSARAMTESKNRTASHSILKQAFPSSSRNVKVQNQTHF